MQEERSYTHRKATNGHSLLIQPQTKTIRFDQLIPNEVYSHMEEHNVNTWEQAICNVDKSQT